MLVDQWYMLYSCELGKTGKVSVWRNGLTDVQTLFTHLDCPTYPVEDRDPYLRTRFSDTGGKIALKPWKRDEGCLSLLHPLFNPQGLSYLVFTNKSGIARRVDNLARLSGGSVWCLVGGKGSLDYLQRTGKCLGCKAGCLLSDFLRDIRIISPNTPHEMSSRERKRVDRGDSVRTSWTRCMCRSQVNPTSRRRGHSPFRGQFWSAR